MMKKDFSPKPARSSLDASVLVSPEYRALVEPLPLRGAYFSRAGRSKFLSVNFPDALAGEVLDVGASGRALSDFVRGGYTSLDLTAGSDLVCNLDDGPIPCEDRSFDTVICTDVLEHLENIHAAFGELLRVARCRVILSLPNPYRKLFKRLRHPQKKWKFYGLPLEIPEDRHRCVYSAGQAVEFLVHNASRASAEKVRMALYCKGGFWSRVGLRSLLLTKRRYLHVVPDAVWAEILVGPH